MNKARRKELRSIADRLDRLKDDLEALKGDEEDAMAFVPENLRNSERYKASEETVAALEDALWSLGEAAEAIEDALDE